MDYQLIWSPTARLDFQDLLAYIAEDDPLAARNFARGFFSAIEQLAEFPESGRSVPEFNEPTIRELIRRPCRIVYRVRSEIRQIEIVRVWHGARGRPEL